MLLDDGKMDELAYVVTDVPPLPVPIAVPPTLDPDGKSIPPDAFLEICAPARYMLLPLKYRSFQELVEVPIS